MVCSENLAKMSGKIKAKDLSYDASLPPFLQKLHDRMGGREDSDRHERPIARGRIAKDPNEDDGPTIVDQSGELVGKDEFEKLANSTSANPTADELVEGQAGITAESKASSALPNIASASLNITNGTLPKKRKVGKIVGNNDDAAVDPTEMDSSSTKAPKKSKKNSKPVKLAFDNDDEP